MKQFIFNIIFASTLLSFISSCGNSKGKVSPETETKTDSTKKEENIAEVTPEQMKAVGIELGLIEPHNLSSAVKATGQLTVPPQNHAAVNALVGGVIRKITVVEGQQVRKGQVVAVIENPEFIRLQQEYLYSKDNIVYLRQEYERQKTLQEADAGIGKVYQQAAANYAAEQSKLRTLEAQLMQIHINAAGINKGNLVTEVPVPAPISGTVGKVNLGVGTYTDASSPIMEITNNNTIYCDLQVFEKDIALIKPGQNVSFSLPNQNDKKFNGKVYGINRSLDTGSRTTTVHTVVQNTPLNLIAGQYVTALIETGKQSVNAVPKDAIVHANDKTYIFVFEGTEQEPVKKDADDKEANDKHTQQKYHFKMIEVVTGVEELGYVEIKEFDELPPNTKIVTKGAFYVYTSMLHTETNDID
ncbi:MAG TPA: efflux RND transporter periplasmic adaptor subunit [Flavisolibacter sp.]|nr:efflux RND transporter periplasmic adaptor subunit [Flavisolibacter sp.]